MSSEMQTFYFFKDGTVICLLHYVNNKYAAEKAMLQAYRRTSSDISHSGSKSNVPYTTFDGRDYH